MAMSMCIASSIKCSSNTPAILSGVQNVKSTLSSAVKPLIRGLEKSAIRTEAGRAIKTVSLTVLDAFVDSMFHFVDQPLLPSQKNFSPVEEIGKLAEVYCTEGQIPADFPEGVYIRNGTNPLFGGLKSAVSVFGKTESVWIEGEGMLHALYLTKDATGNWNLKYNNRYVQTDTYKMESQRKKPAFIPTVKGDPLAALAASFFNKLRFGEVNKIMSNTNVFEHGGKYYSVTENYLPQEIDLVSLETLGNWNPGGAWSRPFTSHPKKAPGTAELVVVGFDATKPYAVVGVISADGKELINKLDLQLNCSTVFHEVGVTDKYNILIDHSLTIDVERVTKGGQLFEYETEKNTRIAVIPRYGGIHSIKWFPIEPCCIFHLINSFEDRDEASNNRNGSGSGVAQEGMLFTCIREWRLNLKTSEVKERDISGTGFSMDFPMINAHFTGLKHKYGYTQVINSAASSTSGKTKYGGLAKLYFEEEAMEEGKNHKEKVKMEYYWLPKNNYCTGSAFVPKQGAIEEDDGWILTYGHDEETEFSYVLVVDAKNLGDRPIAKICLPQRVPYGHHGSFFCLSKQEIDINIKS